MKRLLLIFFLLLTTCQPAALTPLEEPTQININFTTRGSEKIIDAATLLSKYISTEEFHEFALAGNFLYHNNGYSNQEIYEIIREDWDINVAVICKSTYINTSMYYRRDENEIVYQECIGDNRSLNKIASVLLHEYLHQKDFNHETKWAGTPSFYFQFEFEKFLNEYNR